MAELTDSELWLAIKKQGSYEAAIHAAEAITEGAKLLRQTMEAYGKFIDVLFAGFVEGDFT